MVNAYARNLRLGLALAAAGALAACGGGSTASTSTLNLGITDAPLDNAMDVVISFTGVEVKPVNGAPIDFNFTAAQQLHMLTLTGGQTATFLNGKTVPAGQYEWVRLMIDPTVGSSYLMDSTGGQHNLIIPSGAESGLKLIQGFTMPVGGVANFTVDFVLSKSIIMPPGQSPDYMLKPVLRLVDNAQVGTIAGTFQSATLTAQNNCGTHPPVVYVYPGAPAADFTPDDIYVPANGATDAAPVPPAATEVEPLVTQTATLNSSNQYAFSIPFLLAGDYAVAFTCDPDDPAADESATMPSPIHFTTYSANGVPAAVPVTMNAITTITF